MGLSVERSSRSKRDERRHEVGPEMWWGETWAFEVTDLLVGLELQVRFTVYPRRRVAWFWAAVNCDGAPYVLCRDVEVPLPAQPEVLEIRSGALWSHAICETPFEHWTVAMEAYAVSLDDPEEAWRQEHGTRIGLAFDLEWEANPPGCEMAEAERAEVAEGIEGYTVLATVTGDIQIDELRHELTGTGRWSHQWGALGDEWLNSLHVETGRSNLSVQGPEALHQISLK